MRIIISPSKKMIVSTDGFAHQNLPQFLNEAQMLQKLLQKLSYDEAKTLWCCDEKIATYNYELLQNMDLNRRLTPAIQAYEGIQFKYMAPNVFETEQFEYIENHVRILSGFYGLLRPFDGVVPYRLEMQAKLKGGSFNSLYEFWGKKLAKQLFSESDTVVNLASKEYSRCISNFIPQNAKLITCVFGQLINDKIVEKGIL